MKEKLKGLQFLKSNDPPTVVVTRSLVTLDEDGITPNKFNKSVNQAQIRQTITKTYPSKRPIIKTTNQLIPSKDFKPTKENVYSSDRVVWIDIPLDYTAEKVSELLAENPSSCIYRLLSTRIEDVMTNHQISITESEDYTENFKFFQDQLVVKNNNGEIVTRNGLPLYRQCFWSKVLVEDLDFTITPNAEEKNEF